MPGGSPNVDRTASNLQTFLREILLHDASRYSLVRHFKQTKSRLIRPRNFACMFQKTRFLTDSLLAPYRKAFMINFNWRNPDSLNLLLKVFLTFRSTKMTINAISYVNNDVELVFNLLSVTMLIKENECCFYWFSGVIQIMISWQLFLTERAESISMQRSA